MAKATKIAAPIEFHAVRNKDGSYRVTMLSEARSRMGAEGERPMGVQETVLQNCRFTATVYGEHDTVEIGEKRG